jgi:exonuclease VII large subunit
VAKDFEQSQELESAAEALRDRNLADAAKELGDVADKLADLPADLQAELEKALQEASENQTRGLEDLAKNLEDAAKELQQQNQQGAGEALENAAQELQQISQAVERQQLREQARQALQGLAQAMMRRQQGEKQQQAGENGQDEQASEGEPGQQQMPGGEKGQAAAPGGGNPLPAPGNEPGDGGGLEPSQGLGTSSQEEGAPTQLDVQLEVEKLTGLHEQGAEPEDLEEASKQERSKLDYKNVESDLTPAQKDLLNQDRIPWEYRPLIKNYFQAIKPPK